MGSAEQFQDILKSKMGVAPQKEASFQPITTGFSLHSSTWIEPPTSIHRSVRVSRVYPQKPRPQKATAKVNSPTQPKKTTQTQKNQTISILKLSEKSQKAYFLMIRLGAPFEDGQISPQRLKQEYRRLAKIFHPDSSHKEASPKKFHILHTCNKILEKELASTCKDFTTP